MFAPWAVRLVVGVSISGNAARGSALIDWQDTKTWRVMRRNRLVAGIAGLIQTPILPPPLRVIATRDGRGGKSGLKSGQRVAGSSNVESLPQAFHSLPSSAGCWTATNSVCRSGVKQGPHISAPAGQRKKCFDVPRTEPSVSTAQMPSLRPLKSSALPSVAIQSRPIASKAQLSGLENQPSVLVNGLKVAPIVATEGSPHFTRISHLYFAAE